MLSSIGEYDTARMELREGAASSLRKDLEGAAEDFQSIKEQVAPTLGPGGSALGFQS